MQDHSSSQNKWKKESQSLKIKYKLKKKHRRNLNDRNKHWLRVKGWKNIYQANGP
jgi:hypothetical protein